MKNLVSGYASAKDRKDIPLGSYLGVTAIFLGIAAFAVRSASKKKLHLSNRDLILYGASVHKLSRIVTKDAVTSPFRAPFTRYQCSLGYGEFQEESRRSGILGTAGDLISCNYCFDPWVALLGLLSLTYIPDTARVAMQGLSAVALADFLHVLYETIRTQENVLTLEEDRVEKKTA